MNQKIIFALLLAHILLFSAMLRKSTADDISGSEINSILPGEPNPTNHREEGDIGTRAKKEQACKNGEQRYPVKECVKEGTPKTIDKDCDEFSLVLKCGKKPFKIHCPNGKIARERNRCTHVKRALE